MNMTPCTLASASRDQSMAASFYLLIDIRQLCLTNILMAQLILFNTQTHT